MQYQQIPTHGQVHEGHDGLGDEIEDSMLGGGDVHHSHHQHHPHHTHHHQPPVLEPSLHHAPQLHLVTSESLQHQADQIQRLQQHQLAQLTSLQHSLHHPHHPHHPHPLQHPHALSHHPDFDAAQLQHQIESQLQSNLHNLNSAAAQLHQQLGDPNDPHRLHQQIDASDAAHYQQQLEKQGLDGDMVVHEGMVEASGGKKRKTNGDKPGHFNVCLALGCERQIKQRRLCPMHQKQKERSGGKIELKENVKFTKGRTPTPFSRHANKYAKLKTFDKKIDEWAGGKEEGTLMLDAYLESSYHQNRFPKQEDAKIYEQIGRNIVDFMKQLPEKSPLRRPLIKAMSEGVPLARLREVLPVSKQTVINSKKLSDSDNLLLTIKYKPNVTRNRKRTSGGLELGSPMSPPQGLSMGQGGEETIVNAVVANGDELAYPNSQMGGMSGLGGLASYQGGMPSMAAITASMGMGAPMGMGGMNSSLGGVTPQLNSLTAPLSLGVVNGQ